MNNPHDNIIVFDGLCNLCDGAVRFILRHDKNRIFRFTQMQSQVSQALLGQGDLDTQSLDTFILIRHGRIHKRSDAALIVAHQLGFPWHLFVALRVIPSGIRDFAYNAIAKNRYKWFGQRSECGVPSKDIKDRFIL